MFDRVNDIEEFYVFESEEEMTRNRMQEYEDLMEIKKMLTAYRLSELKNLDEVNKDKDLCYQRVYAKLMKDFGSDESLGELQRGLQKCKKGSQDVKEFLKNVDKLSELKMVGCTKNCRKYQSEDSLIKCQWMCYNKLDRRYREYWLQQRNDIIERHKLKMFY